MPYQCKISECCKRKSGMGRKVVWIVKTSFSVGVAGGKELTSDSKVGEGIT